MPGVSIPNLLKDMSSREATYITVQNPKSHTLPKLQITKDEIGTILLKTEILKTMNNNNKMWHIYIMEHYSATERKEDTCYNTDEP